jgi:hypothetical protein
MNPVHKNLYRPRISSLLPRAVGALCLALACGVVAPPAFAQDLTPTKPPSDKQKSDRPKDRTLSPQREELKKRFEQRLPRINGLKDKGVVGETAEGWLEAVDDRLLSKDDRSLLEDENHDRKTLYGLIADRVDEPEKDKKTVPARVVAERNAHRKFENAKPQHYLKTADSRWIQKRDEDRANRIAQLKDDGVVGEMSDGYLGAVKGKPSDEVKSLVDDENRARRDMYGEIARKLDKGSADDVASTAAKDMRQHMPPGHYFKERSGDWQKQPKS